jgi:hypothetical protein
MKGQLSARVVPPESRPDRVPSNSASANASAASSRRGSGTTGELEGHRLPPKTEPPVGMLQRPDLARLAVRALLARPPAPLLPQLLGATEHPTAVHERWLLQSEPGPRGRVPVLCVRPTTAGVVGKQLPVVVVLHGTGGNKEQMIPHLQRFASQGFLACSLDSRYHGERGDGRAYIGALLEAFHANARGEEGAEHPSCTTPHGI